MERHDERMERRYGRSTHVAAHTSRRGRHRRRDSIPGSRHRPWEAMTSGTPGPTPPPAGNALQAPEDRYGREEIDRLAGLVGLLKRTRGRWASTCDCSRRPWHCGTECPPAFVAARDSADGRTPPKRPLTALSSAIQVGRASCRLQDVSRGRLCAISECDLSGLLPAHGETSILKRGDDGELV